MKSLTFSLVIALFISSCTGSKNPDVRCVVRDNSLGLRNANTTLEIDNNLKFYISFRKNQVTGQKGNPSVFLTGSAGNAVTFIRDKASSEDISDEHGDGKMLKVEARSSDDKIVCELAVSAYSKFPDVFLVQAFFRNISGEKYEIKSYNLNDISIARTEVDEKWWSFQGAAYHWGLDFAFPLPEKFRRENFMGLNEPKSGAGIPLIDFWNKDYGLALASISDRPELISLPVKAEEGTIDIAVRDTLRVKALRPEENLATVKTAIILHEGDFYEPLRKYAGLMDPVLPDFQKPGELSWQPEWCTWGYRQSFTPENILSKIDTFHTLGMKSVILDDGWSENHGDWIPDRKKFPKGDEDYKKLVNTLHENGLKVWIWWLPGYADSTTNIAKNKLEWLIMNEDGSIHQSYGFCPAYGPVQEHYKELVEKFAGDYKLDGLKLDFGEINSAAPCYNPKHHHNDPYESYYSTPLLFRNIYETAKELNPEMVIEYCSCSIPPNIFHLPYMNLAVTSDPNIAQITRRIKMYKALIADDFPVLEEYCGVLSGPTYQLAIGAGGVPGTFSVYLDDYHKKWMGIYREYQLSRGRYLNLYDVAFDYPEGHAIEKDGSMYYAFYTHPWNTIEQKRWWRFGLEWDSKMKGNREAEFPVEAWTGKLELRGLDKGKRYQVLNYDIDMDLGRIGGKDPVIDVSFENYLLLKVTPVN